MKQHIRFASHGLLIAGLLGMILNFGCKKTMDTDPAASLASSQLNGKQLGKDLHQVNLVGSDDEYAPLRVDPLLKNAWGIAFSGGGTAWISAEATGTSAVYNKEGVQQLAAVNIPSPTANTGGHPTGQVNNTSSDFKLPNGNAARFIFVGVDGVVSGWNGGASAVRVIDSSANSAYTGLAIGSSGGNNYLYAADFRSRRIETFDKNWLPVPMTFRDPNLPPGYAPFNIQNLAGKLYVAYAKVSDDGEEEAHPGFGVVSVFNTDGSFVKRFTTYGQLNAPWGLALAAPSFYPDNAPTEPTLLVGNFGDGTINAFSMDGSWLGVLRQHGAPIVIEGLWAISFPPVTATTVDPNRLYFAAGPEDEEEGLFGYIVK